jgi:hypothetical protein
MAAIPAIELQRMRQSAAVQVAPTYTKEQFNLGVQAAVDELLLPATANGLNDKMNAANPGFSFTTEEETVIRALAHEEAARQT